MKEIKRELRELGESIREEMLTGSGVSPRAMRRIRARRIGFAVVTLGTAAVLFFGGSYAVATFRGMSPHISPAGEPGPLGPSFALFYAHFDEGRAGVNMDAETGIICAFLESLTDHESITRVEIVAGAEAKASAVALAPSQDAISIDQAGSKCVGDIQEKVIRSITGSPHRYFLLIEASGEEFTAPMLLETSEELPDEDACKRAPGFVPTYLPRDWVPELQEGSGAGGGAEDIVLGHYGSDAPPGSLAKLSAGFLDVIASRGAYEADPDSELRVLGGPAALKGPNDKGGFSVQFGFRGCVYWVGGSASRRILIRFVEGLRPTTRKS